jgi:hypothetical protein
MSEVLVSLHGRRVGLDKDGYLTTDVGIKVPTVAFGTSGSEVALTVTATELNNWVDGAGDLQTLSSGSTGTAVNIYGVSQITSTQNQNWTIAGAAAAGVRKVLLATGGSTSSTVTASGCNFCSTAATSTGTVITFTGIGQSVTLTALSTLIWALTGDRGTVAVT